jgi:pimeloyl-ACP methyl ester carboxylesterase
MSNSGVNDNPDPIYPGLAVSFPSPSVNPYGIQRNGSSTTEFVLPPDSVFEITFQVTIQNTGQFVVVLNGTELIETVVGHSGGGAVVGMCIIITPPSTNSIISINNPSTAAAGGVQIDEASGALTQPLSCHLIIKKLQ